MKLVSAVILISLWFGFNLTGFPLRKPPRSSTIEQNTENPNACQNEPTAYIVLPKSANYGECFEDPKKVEARHQELARIAFRLLHAGTNNVHLAPEQIELGHELYLVVRTTSLAVIQQLQKDPDVSRVFPRPQYKKDERAKNR